jgi:hypothetical protein
MHITVLEATAVWIALQKFSWCTSENLKIHLFIDNTSVLSNLVRKKSPPSSFVLNSRIMAIKQTALWRHIAQVEYIHTELNPADAPSRAERFKMNEWIHLLRTHRGPATTQTSRRPTMEPIGVNLKRFLDRV